MKCLQPVVSHVPLNRLEFLHHDARMFACQFILFIFYFEEAKLVTNMGTNAFSYIPKFDEYTQASNLAYSRS